MSVKISSKKKILIAASLLGIFLIGAIVSIVLVLAASTQGVSSNITVSYNAEGVAAKVSATYAKVPLDTSATVTKTAMTTSGGGQEITFNISNAQTTESISPAGDIELDPQNQKVVFEYVFENLAETAFSISLTQRPTGTNMTETFYVSGTRLSEGDYRTRISKTTLAPQAITSLGQKVYIYIMASVTNENLKASYNGGFAWELKAQNTIDITLNTDGATSTLKVIPNTITGLEEIAMPVLNTMPTKTDYNFDGYYTEDDTQYINGFGTSAHIADLAENTVLYADWNQEELVIEDNVVYGLTDVGKTATTIEIPEGTRAIGDSALSGSSLTNVTIPNSVETIGNNAFYNSTNLETVTIGDSAQTASYADGSSLKAIGLSAFNSCSSLTSISIPDGVTSIGGYAFYNCSGLTSINIPDGVTSIGGYAFNNCSKLTEVNITSLEAWCNITFGDYSSNPTYYAKGLTLNGTLLTEIEIPETITKINSNVFYNCSGLTSIYIPEGVTSIGRSAFDGCSRLTSVSIPEGVTSIGTYAFYGCSSLTSVSIPSSVTSIGTYAFSYCSSLESIELPYVFGDTPSSSESAFSKLFGSSNSAIPSTLTTVVINGGTSMGIGAFQYWSGLTNITIPEGIISIGGAAFYNCSSLVQVRNLSGQTMQGYTAPSYAEIKTDDSPFTTTLDIGNKYAIFIGKDGVKRLLTVTDRTITTANDIPSDVTVINNYAFQYCSGLTSVSIPESVTSIGAYSFYGCSSLTSITIPEGVTSIGQSAFSDCSNLTGINIPEGVTSIGGYAFFNCSKLTSINIPEGVTSIGTYAFYGCTALTEINWNAKKLSSALSIYNYIFNNAGKNGSGITVKIGEEVEEIPAYLFYISSSGSRPNVISVVLPEGSTWIRSKTKGATTGTPVTESAATIAANLAYLSSDPDYTANWSTYYLIRTDK